MNDNSLHPPMQQRSRPRVHTLVLIVVCVFGSSCSGFRTVDPNQLPTHLEPDDGLVLLHLDTEVRLNAILVTREGGSTFTVGGPFEAGRHLWVAVAPAGRYRFERIERSRFRDTLHHEPPYEAADFEIVAGEINYPGMLNVDRGNGLGGSVHALWIQIVNRSSLVIPELESAYPGLHSRYAVRYAGNGRDLSLERIRAERADRAPSATVSASGPRPPVSSGLP